MENEKTIKKELIEFAHIMSAALSIAVRIDSDYEYWS
jgi:hypothetical protein